jgi:hypothetical protein
MEEQKKASLKPAADYNDPQAHTVTEEEQQIRLSEDYSDLKERFVHARNHLNLAHQIIKRQKDYIAHIENMLLGDDKLYKNDLFKFIKAKIGDRYAKLLFGKYSMGKFNDLMEKFEQFKSTLPRKQ